jgi:hypothetical protein
VRYDPQRVVRRQRDKVYNVYSMSITKSKIVGIKLMIIKLCSFRQLQLYINYTTSKIIKYGH